MANVTEEGLLRPLPIGGVDPRVIISKRVLCGDDAVPGVIGASGHPSANCRGPQARAGL